MSIILNAINTLLLWAARVFDTPLWKSYEHRFYKFYESMGKPLTIDLFRPELFLFALLAFLGLGVRVATKTTLIWVYAGAAYYFGIKLSHHLPRRRYIVKTPTLLLGFSVLIFLLSLLNMLTTGQAFLHPVIAVTFILLFLAPVVLIRGGRWVMGIALSTAFASMVIGIWELYLLGGTPLLDPTLFLKHNVILTTLSFLIVPAMGIVVGLGRKKQLPKTALLFLVTVLLMALLGYRTEVIAAILVFMVTLHYLRLLPRGWAYTLGLLLVFSVVGLGVVKAESAGVAEPLGVLTTRAEAALAISDYITAEAGPFGIYRGRVHLSGVSSLTGVPGPRYGPRTLIANALSSRSGVTITATIFGPILLDFGTVGAIIYMFLFGGFFGYIHKSLSGGVDYAIYGLLLSFSLISVETGLVDGIVLFYYVVGAIYFFSKPTGVQNA